MVPGYQGHGYRLGHRLISRGQPGGLAPHVTTDGSYPVEISEYHGCVLLLIRTRLASPFLLAIKVFLGTVMRCGEAQIETCLTMVKNQLFVALALFLHIHAYSCCSTPITLERNNFNIYLTA